MSEEKKIYVVEHGAYSDYTVDGIFTTREKADEYARRYNLAGAGRYRDDAEVVERELDPEYLLPSLRRIVYIRGRNFDSPEFQINEEALYIDFHTAAYYGRSYGWHGQGVGASVDQAMKSAQDAVAEAKSRLIEEG